MTRFCTCAALASPVDLSRKRKQVDKITCMTCGRPLADGTRPPSASMLSTVSLELTNFINPELTWTTVTKGFRSGTRRSRKPARSLNVGVQQDVKGTKREESSCSESEKLGVAVLERRFADKIQHVPIKKRRLLLRSPSPPPQTPSPYREESLSSQHQTTSPQPEDSDRSTDGKYASVQWCFSESVSNWEMGAFKGPVAVQFSQGKENAFVNGKLSGVTTGKLGYTEDFSGIALLAAAACNNGISDDDHNVEEVPIVDELLTPKGTNSCMSATTLERTMTSSETGNLFLKESAHEKNIDGSVVEDNSMASEDAHNVEEGPIVDDLLTPKGTDSCMSATALERTMTSSETGNLFLKESAHEDIIDGSMVQDNSMALSQNFHDKKESEAGKWSASLKDDRLHWDLNTVMEAWELPCDDLNICSQRDSSEGIPDDGVHSQKPEELLKCSTADTDTKIFSKFLDNSPCPGSDPVSSRPLSKEKMNTSPTSVVIQTREDCCRTSAMQLNQTVSIENVQLGEHDAVLLVPAVSEKVACEIDSIQSKEDSRKTFELPDNGTCPTELVSTVTCQTSDVEYSVSKSEKAGPSHHSPEHENLSALGTSVGEGQLVIAVDVEKKQDKTPAADATPMDSSHHVELKEFMPKSYECFSKVAVEDPIDDRYGSDVSHGGHGQMVGVEKFTVIQAGYESPFEDGELRESAAYAWEENEIEGESECVDYDSDNRDEDDFDAANYCMSEIGSDSYQNDNNGSLAEKVMQCGRASALKELSHSVSLKKFSGQDQLPDGFECSTNRTGEPDNVSAQKMLASDSMHELYVNASSAAAAEVGSRASREKLLSHIEGSSRSDALHRQDNVYMQRSRSSYDSCFQSGTVFGSEKNLRIDRTDLRMQDGSQGDGHWVDSPAGYWDSRNHHQTGYRQGSGHPIPRRVISHAKIDGLTYRDQRRSMNYSSRGLYRPLIRRRSPVDSDEVYIVHRRMVGARDNSHIRSRSRSGIYQQGVRRAPREYHGPRSEYHASSSVRLSHYSARRERSFSPVLSRGASFSRPRKSRSRSRTRSPLTWHLQRERNMGVKRLSRSPDFRSEARMERIRIPFQKSNFAADDEDVYISPPRSRFSPESNSRWIDDRSCVAARFRERKSPGRFFGRNQRFDSGGSPGRMKLDDDCFRSKIHPGRFTELSGGAGRGHKYDGGSDCERTEYRDKSEVIHQVRRRGTRGVVRRLPYQEMHNTRTDDSFVRGTDRRDNIPRSAREERGPFRYNN